MKSVKNYVILVGLALYSCYGINERTSAIASINYSCGETNWQEIIEHHSVANITNDGFKQKITEFQKQPFETILLYFKSQPEEIIGISTDHYQIRYIYNPELSNEVLDGFSKKLDDKEVSRIKNRIYKTLEKYGCIENK